MDQPFQLSGDFRLLLSDKVILHAPWTLQEHPSWTYQVVSLAVPRLGQPLIDLEGCRAEIHPTAKSDRNHCLPISIPNLQSISWAKWFVTGIHEFAQRGTALYAGLFLILPANSGSIVRSNIIQMRLLGWQNKLSVYFQDEPGQAARSMMATRNIERLDEVFDTAAAGVLMQADETVYQSATILEELAARLNFSWVVEGPFVRRRIGLVDGGFNFQFRKDMFAAATHLGIDLVVFDKPNHWVQTYKGETGSLVDFVSIDMTMDAGLPHRIADAIRAYHAPFDGVTTFTDSFLYATAQAANMLSLPTNPVETFETIVNKARMRELVPLPIIRETAFQEHSGVLESRPGIIVKPAEGGGSQAVFLARNSVERLAAESFIRKLGKEPVVERYLDGPEVDVNVVLQDGVVLLAEVSDNLPTTAEGFPSKYKTSSWLETGTVFPSGLPSEELDLLRNSTASCLLKGGFRSGVFHCEARVVHSSFIYSPTKSLYPRLMKGDKDKGSNFPSVAIIELNARAPGFVANVESMHASGVDFNALQLLAACGDNVRFPALARPFTRSIGWWGSGYVAAERGGTFAPSVMFEELKVEATDLMKHVVRWTIFFKPGEILSDPASTGKYIWVAWFLVYSSNGRTHLENIVESVRSSLRFEII